MSPCQSSAHPQVPVTVVTLTATYCHQCFGWRLDTYVHTVQDDDVVIERQRDIIEYGPFDDVGLVLDDACAALGRELAAPGRPWDTGDWPRAEADDPPPPR